MSIVDTVETMTALLAITALTRVIEEEGEAVAVAVELASWPWRCCSARHHFLFGSLLCSFLWQPDLFLSSCFICRGSTGTSRPAIRFYYRVSCAVATSGRFTRWHHGQNHRLVQSNDTDDPLYFWIMSLLPSQLIWIQKYLIKLTHNCDKIWNIELLFSHYKSWHSNSSLSEWNWPKNPSVPPMLHVMTHCNPTC